MDDTLHPLIATAIERHLPCVFVAPHLDDAALSAGALIAKLAQHTNVTVATVFTRAHPERCTRSAAAYVRQCGAHDAETLYAARRAEDIAAMTDRGVTPVHLGFTDALWRPDPAAGRVRTALGTIVPELSCLYPTYRWHVVTGRIAAGDDHVAGQVTAAVAALLRDMPTALVFGPRGRGGHVDHCITRHAALIAADNRPCILWDDVPYILNDTHIDCPNSNNDTPLFTWNKDADVRRAFVAAYRTQTEALSADRLPDTPESYWSPAHAGGHTTLPHDIL